MDQKQQERIAQNESRFRGMNEQIDDAIEAFSEGSERGDFSAMCECASTGCVDMVELSRDEYAHVRSNARWFVVKPEHFIVEVETPVECNDRFWIIEKIGRGGVVAESLA